MSSTKNELEKILSQGPRADLSNKFSKASGVALILCGSGSDLELLFIKRATNPTDRWSGQIAFPGGKQHEEDPSLLATCLREVHEEVGIQLSPNQWIGSLDDLQALKHGSTLDFYIQPFVFYVEEKPFLKPDASEVAAAFWLPLNFLGDPARRTTYRLPIERGNLDLPAIQLPGGDMLWGLSYMMIQNFFQRLGI